ncbi:DUF4012 domain-containing protein [Leifsonia shinshuensis]|uniref:DUF4012 domain-containing protein n=1 Tax=Leifsonia shinshuensis TaxID=150026 RepID=A0A7G6Y9L9_9MICO|nr:DUF4012 domain-containing protein [Leifsonia shinshuensis]QNE35184.1 DUF4012 domain-containing protein [Leifsonia shinshuensis]
MSNGLAEDDVPPVREEERRRRPILVAVLLVILVLLLGAAWIGFRAYLARGELKDALADVQAARSAVESGNTAQARSIAADLSRHARSAADLTSDPIWRAGEAVPWFGSDLAAVRTVAAATDTLASQVVEPLASAAAAVDPRQLTLSHGRIDLAPLIAAGPAVEKAETGFVAAQRQIDAIDEGQLVSPVSRAVTKMRTMLDAAGGQLEAVANTARLLPGMLGADGPRTYLVVAQNPAEIRATGGLIGSVTEIRTDHGAITLAAQSASFGPWAQPVFDVPAPTTALFGTVVGRYLQDANVTPDFALAARTASAMWVHEHGGVVDGVIALDPVVLSGLLRAAGPVSLPTGDTLTADNAVQLLLSDVYHRYSNPADQDAFFASAAGAVFAEVADGGASGSALVDVLAQAGASDRVRIWSSRPAEQRVLADTTLAGGLPVSTPDNAALGVYFNDATGGKMDYYLGSSVSAGAKVCRADGRVTSRVEVTLSNRAPANAATTLSDYVTGGDLFGVARGSILTRIAFYGPQGGLLGGVRSGGAGLPSVTGSDGGRPVAVVEVELTPGESKTVDVEFLGTAQKRPGVTVAVTPTLNGDGTTPVMGAPKAIGTIAVPCTPGVK